LAYPAHGAVLRSGGDRAYRGSIPAALITKYPMMSATGLLPQSEMLPRSIGRVGLVIATAKPLSMFSMSASLAILLPPAWSLPRHSGPFVGTHIRSGSIASIPGYSRQVRFNRDPGPDFSHFAPHSFSRPFLVAGRSFKSPGAYPCVEDAISLATRFDPPQCAHCHFRHLEEKYGQLLPCADDPHASEFGPAGPTAASRVPQSARRKTSCRFPTLSVLR
jgi:hypothetical protein